MKRIAALRSGIRTTAAALLLSAVVPLRADSLSVAVAANFQPVLVRIAESFFEKTSHRILISSAATGNLLSQLLHGAPYDVFLSADTMAIRTLVDKQRADPSTVTAYAFGTLVAVSAGTDSSVTLIGALSGSRRISIAQPTVAPYGTAARQVLEASHLWTTLEKRFVYARSVGQSFQFALTGGADIAFVALSTLIASGKPFRGVWRIDSALYSPIEQRLAIISGTPHRKTAERLTAFFRFPEVTTIIRSFGYGIPEER